MKQKKLSIMLILFVSGLVIMMNLYLTIPLTKSISETFKVTTTQAGLLSSLFSIGFALGCLIYGLLSEKFGRKKIILIGIVTLTLVTLLIGFSQSFYMVLSLRFLQGLTASTFSPVALAFAGEYFNGSTKTTAIGLISTGFLMAGIFGQILATSINNLFTFQMVFITMGCLLLITGLGLLLILPKTKANSPQLDIRKSFSNIKVVLRKKELLLCYFVAFFLLMSFVLMYNLLTQKLSLPPFNLTASELLNIRLAGLIGMLFSPLAGNITQKISVKYLLTVSLSLTVISSLMMSIASSLISLLVLSVLFVLGIALAVPSLVSLVNIFGAFERGLAVSIYTFVLFLGTSAAPFIGSFLMPYADKNLSFLGLVIITLLPTVASVFIPIKDN